MEPVEFVWIGRAEVVEFVRSHSVASAVAFGLWLWISLCLIVRMWMVRSDATILHKLCWSLMLLVPLLGWAMYGGFYQMPSHHNMPLPPSTYE